MVDFRTLPQTTLKLDWTDPWYSEFDEKPLKRKIGTGMRNFLYIEPFEVRNEILVRVKDLMNWVAFDLRGDDDAERQIALNLAVIAAMRRDGPLHDMLRACEVDYRRDFGDRFTA